MDGRVSNPRPAALQSVLELSRSAVVQAAAVPGDGSAAAARIFHALDAPPGESPGVEPVRLPVCAHLGDALEHARHGPGVVPALADALDALAPRLAWWRRAGTAPDSTGFHDGHANALIAGPAGLERREDVMVGLSLIAPHVRYPDHRHPPEELYVVLSDGQWRQRDGPWHTPGPGGIVYNPPGIVHAMRSGATPLLALWFLWLRDADGERAPA